MNENFPNRPTKSVCEFVDKYTLYKAHTIADIKTVIEYYILMPVYKANESSLIQSFLKQSFSQVHWDFVQRKLDIYKERDKLEEEKLNAKNASTLDS